MNKQSWATNALRIIIVIIILVSMFIIINEIDKYEQVTGTVVNVEENDCITMIDRRGETWAFFADGLEIGNMVKVTINTHQTDTYEDDEIVNVKLY